MDETWEEENSVRRMLAEQLQKGLLFVQDHEKSFKELDEQTRPHPTLGVPQLNHFPICMAMEPPERVFPLDLMMSDNASVNKVLTVLVYLCDEINELKEMAETKFYGTLVVFGQRPCEKSPDEDLLDNPFQSGEKERMVGKMLITLQELSNFVDRCYFVAVNLVQQLSALLNAKEPLYRVIFQKCRIFPAFSSLADLLSILITLDSIIEQNEYIASAWSEYKVLMALAKADPKAYGVDPTHFALFEKLLLSIDQGLLVGDIFKACIEQDFQFVQGVDGHPDMQVNVRNNSLFLENFKKVISYFMQSALTVVGTSMEVFERTQIVGYYGLYALYRQLQPANVQPDLKWHMSLFWETQKRVPWIILCNQKTIWFPGDFILKFSNGMNDKKIDPSVVGANKKAAFTKFVQAFTQSASSIIAQCNSWFILADSCITPSIRFDANPVEALELRFGVLIKGLTIAMRVNNLMKSYIVMHEVMMEPIGKSALQDIGALIELLKAIEYTFTRKQTDIALGYSLIMRLFSEEILKVVQPIRNRLEATRKVDNAKSAVLATMNLLVNILRSSDSMQFARMATVQFTVDMLGEVDGFAERDVDKIRLVVKRMSLLSSLSKSVRATCDTQFLYFHRGILVHLVNQIYNCPTAPSRLHYIVGAYSNGARACNSVMHYPGDASMFVKNYRQFITACIKKGIVDPLCREIEKDLRLQVHTKTLSHMQAVNPKTENLRPLRPFLDLTPLRYLGVVFDIKATVSHYLDHNFYSLTTIALHDWRTYSDMKALAADKFGLALVDSFLPMGSLDQGLDVLQIMRNINVFVCRFTYNMNMQQFIEFRHDKASKHLNTINIQSIAASIRQHGLGMLNTTVNFTYQFLAQKFNVFSQFIFDDYIRGHLSREARWYKKHRNDAEVNGIYPYERGLKFAKDIRKLGVTDAGKSYLDQFRMLITEIGNALGYVRMVRSASMYFCSEAVKYLPDLDDIIKFEPYANKGVPLNEEDVEPDTTIPGTGANLSAETIDSAKMLDGVIDNLIKNFGEGSDYFKVLVNVFQPVLLTDEQEHLKTFFMIVPSLCISWVEASLQAKDLMYKANKGILSKEMYFTDDGFAMGVAYCLAILKQTRRFESLHWFDGMQAKLNADEEELKKKQEIRAEKEVRRRERIASAKGLLSMFKGGKKTREEIEAEEDAKLDEEEVHTIQLTSKRLEANRREIGQLSYSLTGASIFFKRTDTEV